MAPLDIGILIVVAGYFVNGIRNGLVHEVLGLIGILAGVLAGVMFGPGLSEWLGGLFPGLQGIVLHLLCFTTLFSAFYSAIRMVAGVLKKLLDNLFLGWLNKGAGGVAAAFKGALVQSIAFMYLSFLPYQTLLEPFQKESVLYEPVADLVPMVYEYLGSDSLPDKVKEILHKGKQKIAEESIDGLENDFRKKFEQQPGAD